MAEFSGKRTEFGLRLEEALEEARAWKRGQVALPVRTIHPMPPARVKEIRKRVARSPREFERRFGVPASWITEVMQVESRGHANALSPKGAIGLMQVMPETYADMRARYGLGADPWNERDNVLAGDFVGREAILGSFATLQANVDTYWAYPLDYFGSDDHVVLVALVRATRGAKSLETKECLLWRLDGGKLAEVWHMALDEKAWDAFFSRD